MSNTQVGELTELNRLPTFKLFLLILYLPVGTVLFLLRVILGLSLIILSTIFSDTSVTNKIVNTVACFCLGINVIAEDIKRKEDVYVYISNSVSIFDQLALFSLTDAVSPTTKNGLIKSKGIGSYHCGSDTNLENVTRTIKQLIASKVSVHFSPEGRQTNGKALLKFRQYPFQFATKVQPVCISIERPFLNIAVSVCGSTYFSDLVCFMFSPITNYKIKFLAPLEKKNLSDKEFAEIVRQNIANGLKVEASEFSASDLNDYEKQINASMRVIQRRIASPPNFELERMALQVREVLPHVPLNAIYNDIAVTRSVDVTITNILNGRVHFVRTPTNSPSQPSTSASAASSSANMFNTAAASFPKTTSERVKSFQERKQQLIANARKRYIEKHNLDISI